MTLIGLTTVGCTHSVTQDTTTTSTTGQSSETLTIDFDYFNQILPSTDAIRFQLSNANITWFWQSPPVISPDGTEMYWEKLYLQSMM